MHTPLYNVKPDQWTEDAIALANAKELSYAAAKLRGDYIGFSWGDGQPCFCTEDWKPLPEATVAEVLREWRAR